MGTISVQRTNCDNCGAILTDGYCEYCGTRWFYPDKSKVPEEKTPQKPIPKGETSLCAIINGEKHYICTIRAYSSKSFSLGFGRDINGQIVRPTVKRKIEITANYSRELFTELTRYSSKEYAFLINFNTMEAIPIVGYVSDMEMQSYPIGESLSFKFSIIEV